MQMVNGVSGGRISRAAAMTVPNVVRGRNMLCSIATLPIVQLNAQNKKIDNPLFRQIDPDVPNVVTLSQTIEDLIFDSIAWWEITAVDFNDFPIAARHRDVSSVSLTPPTDHRSLAPLPSGHDPRGASVWIDGREVAASRVIRFDSPNPAVLSTGAKAIRRALLLDAAASMYAEDPRPLDYFTPADGADEIDDDEVEVILAKWKAWRKRRSTGYVPAALQYNSVSTPTPQQMQLVELAKQAGLDIANLFGVDPEDLGISTTSRTYANDVDRRRNKVNDVLAPYMRAVTDRLSMGDVTRRGHRVVFNLDDYLKSNPTERAAVQKTYFDMGALAVDEIRDDEGRPPMPPQDKPQPPERPIPPADGAAADPAQQGNQPEGTMANSRTSTTLHLDAGTGVLDAPTTGVRRMELQAVSAEFRVEASTRTIWGLAIPYGQVVSKWGLKFRFMPGSIEWSDPVSRVKFLRDHEFGKAIGFAQQLTQTKAGVIGKYKLGRSAEADAALMDAEDGVADGLSAGVEFDLEADALFNADDGVYDVYRARMNETSLTAMPAFDDARVTKVAASHTGGNLMEECAICGQRHAPGAACSSRPSPPANQGQGQQPAQPAQPAGLQLSDDQLRALVANPAALAALTGVPAQPAQQQQNQPQPFTLTADQINALAASGLLRTLLGIDAPAANGQQAEDGEQRQVVNPTRRPVVVTATREEAPYRFDRRGNLTRGPKFDFSSDLIHGLRDGNGEALERAQGFVRQWFDGRESAVRAEFVNQADAATLNPATQRPDLYVDQKDFTYPIWDAISKGTITDATPFVLPKFSSSSGLVAGHVENTEPTPGTFVATAQTITPTPVSGKVEISREAWDQGGNPQLSTLIWNQMVRAWFEALEASSVTLLEGLAPTILTITTAAVDSALEQSITSQLAPLQFVRGGFRFRDFFLQVDLYKNLVAAKDSSGRRLFPNIGAQNSLGTVSDFFADLLIAGLRGRPAWALAATSANSSNSYLFDRNDVSGWATPPLRLTMDNISVAKVHVGIWGYKALACTDLTGVRRLAYDPV